MTGRRRPGDADTGAAGLVLLLAVVPLLLAVFLACVGTGAVVYAWLRAGTAADAGAAALRSGQDAEAAARASLSTRLEAGATVTVGADGQVEVRVVPLPARLPGPRSVAARSIAAAGVTP